MVAELVAVSVGILIAIAELIHHRRCRKISMIAFGPAQHPRIWARSAALLRIASLSAVAWGFTTLLLIEPKVHKAAEVDDKERKHVVLVLDVSPSMKLDDSGPSKKQQRSKRGADLMESFFRRVPMEQYRVSVIATFTGAIPVVVDTNDLEVVRNVLNDLPLHHAFEVGDTQIFAGLDAAAEIAKNWNPRSTTIVLLSDGDTVPAKGMPKMPASVANVLVIGVGDTRKGKFIAGHNSKQDASTLRQIAIRLNGTYHNGNEKHISSDTLNLLTKATEASALKKLSKREYAMIACAAGSSAYVLLPLLLYLFGTGWTPGIARTAENAQSAVGRKQAPITAA